jgi:hypothetical protein
MRADTDAATADEADWVHGPDLLSKDYSDKVMNKSLPIGVNLSHNG